MTKPFKRKDEGVYDGIYGIPVDLEGGTGPLGPKEKAPWNAPAEPALPAAEAAEAPELPTPQPPARPAVEPSLPPRVSMPPAREVPRPVEPPKPVEIPEPARAVEVPAPEELPGHEEAPAPPVQEAPVRPKVPRRPEGIKPARKPKKALKQSPSQRRRRGVRPVPIAISVSVHAAVLLAIFFAPHPQAEPPKQVKQELVPIEVAFEPQETPPAPKKAPPEPQRKPQPAPMPAAKPVPKPPAPAKAAAPKHALPHPAFVAKHVAPKPESKPHPHKPTAAELQELLNKRERGTPDAAALSQLAKQVNQGNQTPHDGSGAPHGPSTVSASGFSGSLAYRRILARPLPNVRLSDVGAVAVRVTVAPDGSVRSVSIMRSSGVAFLDGVARKTVMHWRFEPLPTGAGPDQSGEITINFQWQD